MNIEALNMDHTRHAGVKSDAEAWRIRALYVLGGCFLLRMFIAYVIPLDLVHDEAYYWEWARRLDVCYYSKPPMVAWLIAASTTVLGDTAFAVRLPAMVLGTWGAFFVYLLASDMFGSRAGFWALLLSLASPGSAALGLIMTIDAPLLFCWSVALYAFWQTLKRDRCQLPWLVCLTLALGIGLLSKQTMLAFPLLATVFLASSGEDRVQLKRPSLWMCMVVALCFLTPILWWNARNGWVTFEHTGGHFSSEQVTLTKRLARFLEFVGSQFGVVSPVTCWLFVSAGLGGLLSFRSSDRRTKFLFVFSVLPLLAACLLALRQRVEPNWAAPAYIAGVVLAVGTTMTARKQFFDQPASNRRLSLALQIGLVTTAAAYLLGFGLGLEGTKLDPAVRLRGWKELGIRVGNVLAEQADADDALLVVTNGRAYASELAFYMPQHPEAFVWNPSTSITSQYDLWGGPRQAAGRTTLIVTAEPHVPAQLEVCFQRVESLRELRVAISPSRQLAVHLWRGVGLDQAMVDELAGFGGWRRVRDTHVAERASGERPVR